jgi:hypothetical protein
MSGIYTFGKVRLKQHVKRMRGRRMKGKKKGCKMLSESCTVKRIKGRGKRPGDVAMMETASQHGIPIIS